MVPVVVVQASSDDLVEDVRTLFEEYAASIGFSLSFQGFDRELAELPGRYAPPTGRLLLARVNGAVAGTVGMRKIGERVCEMKRLFVRPEFHGQGVGRRLVRTVIEEARAVGYEAMWLDTVPAMQTAIALYASMGFRDIQPYTENPIPGARFMELRLSDVVADRS